MSNKGKISAVAYFRTSSMTNVGPDKDSLPRQQSAVRKYAKAHRLDVVREFYDAGVPGRDPVDSRPGFAEMLDYLAGNGARMVLVESASRFARDLMVQLVGHDLLQKRGIALVPVDAADYFTNETDTAVLVRQILGAVAQFEKSGLVGRLRKGRERKRLRGGRWVGRKTLAERYPEAAARALVLRHASGSLREIAALLASEGLVADSGKPYSPSTLMYLFRREDQKCSH
jgi:DNA invertase Pin-like site-specific DNA recombinase